MGLLQKTTVIAPAIPAAITPPIATEDSGTGYYTTDIPIPSFQFSMNIGDSAVALFQSVSGFSVTRDVEAIREGGLNNYSIELPGGLSYGHITMKNGLTDPEFFLAWMQEGQYLGYVNNSTSVTLTQRRTTDKGTEDYLSWEFTNAFPVSWSISELSVDNSQSIVIETLEISFDYFTVVKL